MAHVAYSVSTPILLNSGKHKCMVYSDLTVVPQKVDRLKDLIPTDRIEVLFELELERKVDLSFICEANIFTLPQKLYPSGARITLKEGTEVSVRGMGQQRLKIEKLFYRLSEKDGGCDAFVIGKWDRGNRSKPMRVAQLVF